MPSKRVDRGEGRHDGDFTCFSFYATKNLTTGEGGMVTLRSTPQADWIRTASLHGMSRDAWARYTPGRPGGLRRRDARLQVQHDGPSGGDRPPPARPDRSALARRDAIWRRYEDALAARRCSCRRRSSPARATPAISSRCSSTRTMRDQPRRPAACAAGARHRHQHALPGLASASLLCGALQVDTRHVPARRVHLRSHAVAAAVTGVDRRRSRSRDHRRPISLPGRTC